MSQRWELKILIVRSRIIWKESEREAPRDAHDVSFGQEFGSEHCARQLRSMIDSMNSNGRLPEGGMRPLEGRPLGEAPEGSPWGKAPGGGSRGPYLVTFGELFINNSLTHPKKEIYAVDHMPGNDF